MFIILSIYWQVPTSNQARVMTVNCACEKTQNVLSLPVLWIGCTAILRIVSDMFFFIWCMR